MHSLDVFNVPCLGSWTYLPRSANVAVLGYLSAWWAHALGERDHPLHEAFGVFEDLAGVYGSDEILGFADFDFHYFPELGEGEDGGCAGGVDGEGLGLVEDDHDCGCGLNVLNQYWMYNVVEFVTLEVENIE